MAEELPERVVRANSVSLMAFHPPFFTIKLSVGSGFFVRSLVRDMGEGRCAFLSFVTICVYVFVRLCVWVFGCLGVWVC